MRCKAIGFVPYKIVDAKIAKQKRLLFPFKNLSTTPQLNENTSKSPKLSHIKDELLTIEKSATVRCFREKVYKFP